MSQKVLGKYNSAAQSYVYRSHNDANRVELSVTVNDDRIRKEGVDHDGFEKVFALVPDNNGGWQRVDLNYTGTWTDRGGMSPRDSFSMSLQGGGNFDIDQIRKEGVAFGLEVNGRDGSPTTVWLQGWGDNHKPQE